MLIEEIMSPTVVTLSPAHTIETAMRILTVKDIRHIPIIDEENEVVGIISDRDVRDACPSILENNISNSALQQPVERIMKKNVITCHPLDCVEEIAYTMYKNKIGCLPVIKEGKLTGIVTEANMLQTLLDLTGTPLPSSRIEIRAENDLRLLSKVTDILNKLNVSIVSIFVYPNKSGQQNTLVFRIQTMNPLKVIKTLKKAGYNVLWPNSMGMET